MPKAPYIAVRDRENGQIVDFITPEGSVVSGRLPVSATLAERHVCIADATRATVVACFSFEDATILRACGVPATLACGLEHLASKHTQRFAGHFGLKFHSIWVKWPTPSPTTRSTTGIASRGGDMPRELTYVDEDTFWSEF